MLLESLRYVRIMVYEHGSLMPLKAASAKGVSISLSLYIIMSCAGNSGSYNLLHIK